MKSFYKISSVMQHYAWGSLDGISAVTGKVNTDNKPQAELWMGTHPMACSNLETGFSDETASFKDLIDSEMLKLADSRFPPNAGLPFLFKILSAGSPLSLQVHPSRAQAEQGFSRENEAGISLSAAHRNYKDINHKPEIMAALTSFKAMCGFREIPQTLDFFERLSIPDVNDSITLLKSDQNYQGFLRSLLTLAPDKSANLCKHLGERIDSLLKQPISLNSDFCTALKTSEALLAQYPADMGVLSPFYLNVLTLKPGEALFLPAGIMHAYLQGTGFELMANSDNVLRGGLTPKHIDILELLSILDPSPFVPRIISPNIHSGISYFPTPAPDFQLGFFSLENTFVTLPCSAPTIMIAINGELNLKSQSGEEMQLSRGEAAYLRIANIPATVSGSGTAWFATLPSNKADPQ